MLYLFGQILNGVRSKGVKQMSKYLKNKMQKKEMSEIKAIVNAAAEATKAVVLTINARNGEGRRHCINSKHGGAFRITSHRTGLSH